MPHRSSNIFVLATLFFLAMGGSAQGSTIVAPPSPTAPPLPTVTWLFYDLIFNEPGSPINGILNGTFESDGIQYFDFDLTYILDSNPTTPILFNATTITLIESIPLSGVSIEAMYPPRQGCDFCSLLFIFSEQLHPGGTGAVEIITGDLVLDNRPTLAGSRALSSQFVVQVIPVPAAVYLFGSALGLLGWLCRR